MAFEEQLDRIKHAEPTNQMQRLLSCLRVLWAFSSVSSLAASCINKLVLQTTERPAAVCMLINTGEPILPLNWRRHVSCRRRVLLLRSRWMSFIDFTTTGRGIFQPALFDGTCPG